MARDVEYNVTASDKSGAALASAEAKFKASQERIRKESKKTGDSISKDLTGGKGLGEKLLGELLPSFAKAGISGGQLTAAGIAAAAPLIGATLSAAVIGGAGVGGVLGGVYLASKDPRVKAAGTELAANLLGQLEKDAEQFVEPVLRNIAKIEAAVKGMDGRIKSILGNSSGFLDPLVNGAVKGVNGILRGVDVLVSKARPVIESFGRAFDKIGQAAGDAMTIIAGGSSDAAHAVDDLADAVSVVIVGTGAWIRYLTELYGVVTYVPRKISEFSNSLRGADDAAKRASVSMAAATASTSVLAAGQKTVGAVVLSAGEAAGEAGKHMQTYADKMNDAADKGRGLYDSQTQVAQAVADAKKAIDENGKTLSVNTQKGRDNRNVLSELAGKLTSNYQAYVKVNGEGRGAQKVADDNRAAFIKLATQFGASKAKAEGLATQMGLIPAKKNTDFTANTHDAAARVKALQDKINGVKGKSVSVSVIVNDSKLRAVERRLAATHGGAFAGGQSWAATDPGSGVSRTVGPTPVNVSSNVAVSLDGAPFYAMSVRAADASAERAAWRQKVGKR